MKAKIDWQKHIKDWQASGLSKAEYCRQNRVNRYSFYEKSRTQGKSRSLIELPFPMPQLSIEKPPLLEVHFQVPFSIRLRLNLIFGRRL